MWKRRCIWIVLILLAAILYLFANSPMTLTAVLFIIILPGTSIFQAVIQRKSIRAELFVPAQGRKGETLPVELRLTRSWFTAGSALVIKLVIRNEKTCEEAEQQIVFVGGIGKTVNRQILVRFSHCGKVTLEAEKLYVRDLFDLGRCACALPEKAGLKILPDLFVPGIRNNGVEIPAGDSVVGTEAKKGNDPGELHEIREYQAGDPIKLIHWKLTEKRDLLMVREPGASVRNELLLLLDQETENAAPEEIDAMTEVFLSLSRTLAERKEVHGVGWNSRITGELLWREVRETEDCSKVEDLLLEETAGDGGRSLRRCLANANLQMSPAHILLIGARRQSGLRDLFSGCRVTQILPRPCEEGLQPDGSRVIGYDPDTYRDTLGIIEV